MDRIEEARIAAGAAEHPTAEVTLAASPDAVVEDTSEQRTRAANRLSEKVLPTFGDEPLLPEAPRCAPELRSRWEVFARAYAQGHSGAEAARMAGYSEHSARQSAWRLLQDPRVRWRVAEFQCVAERTAMCNLNGMLARLETLYREAMEAGHHGVVLGVLREIRLLRRIRPEEKPVPYSVAELEETMSEARYAARMAEPPLSDEL